MVAVSGVSAVKLQRTIVRNRLMLPDMTNWRHSMRTSRKKVRQRFWVISESRVLSGPNQSAALPQKFVVPARLNEPPANRSILCASMLRVRTAGKSNISSSAIVKRLLVLNGLLVSPPAFFTCASITGASLSNRSWTLPMRVISASEPASGRLTVLTGFLHLAEK